MKLPNKILTSASFVKGRLSERSTWMFWSGAVAGASVLNTPWNYVSFAFGLVAGMIPDDHENR